MLEGFRERKDEVAAALQQLSDVAGSVGAKSLKDRVDHELVKKLEEDRFHLVVVGEFNHGKTTFVNELLGYADQLGISYTAWALWPQNSGGPAGLGACGYPALITSVADPGDFRACLDAGPRNRGLRVGHPQEVGYDPRVGRPHRLAARLARQFVVMPVDG